MTEATQVWHQLRDKLTPFGRLERCEHAFASGWPDVYYNLRRVSGWLELKLAPASGRCPEHLTREQVLWGCEEERAGGHWYLLVKLGDGTWVLLTAGQANSWQLGGNLAYVEPLLQRSGPFPWRAVLDVIAPLPKKEV